MWRSFDWMCRRCGNRAGHLIEVRQGTPVSDWPREANFECGCTPGPQAHDRVVSRTSDYRRAKIQAMISGGTYDTMGQRPLTPFPEPPHPVERYADLKEWVHSPKYREAKARRKKEVAENREKRARAPLLKSGEIDLRVDKLSGDHAFIRE